MPRISLLLPCPQADSAFEDTLASLLRTRPPGADVIVIHDGSYRDNYNLSGEVDYAVASSNRLIALWNAGWDASSGDILVWVRPGAQLDDGWEVACLEPFRDPQVGAVGPLLQVKSGNQFHAFGGVVTSATGTRLIRPSSTADLLGPTSWAAAYRQTALGWFDPIDLVWDDDYLDAFLALSLRKLGYRYEVAEGWEVLLDNPPGCSIERSGPHGLSAARATLRFGGPLQGGFVAGLREDLGRIWSEPWRWRHLRDRLKVSRFRSADQHAASQLEERAVRRQRVLAQSASPAALGKPAGQTNRRAA